MKWLSIALFFSFSISCYTSDDLCYAEPKISEFESITGYWKYVGFANGKVNQFICFDTTEVHKAPFQYSFSTDGIHRCYDSATRTVRDLKYELSADGSEVYFFEANTVSTDTVRIARIGKLDKYLLVLVYELPHSDKIFSELYRRSQP